MTTALAIFVKTPRLSPIKTRLAASLGGDLAIEFYLLCVKAIAATAQQSGLSTYWAVGEDDGLSDPLWQDFSQLHTGLGNLGDRQCHIYETLLKNHQRVLLIGADIPQISVSILQAARSALDDNDFVLGPSTDGGYYLFGGKTSLPRNVWTDVPWSTAQTMQKLEDGLSSKAAHLASLTDMDTESDLMAFKEEVESPLSSEQENILNWIEAS